MEARNAAGYGEAATARAVPSTVPDEPASLTIVGGDGELSVAWGEPDDGGRTIIRYEVQHRTDYQAEIDVFRSASGALMTLPGGVLLALDPQWDTGTAHAFFARNGIKLDRVSELRYLTNGFFVETASGFASLDLANALAGQAGVYLSSPNWWRERTTK